VSETLQDVANRVPGADPLLSAEVRAAIRDYFPRYPTRQAVVLPALHVVNERLGYVPPQAVAEIAALLELAPAQVQDTLSFYGFFRQDEPQGRFRVWVCRSISCAARGGEELLDYLAQRLGVRPGQTTPDGRVSLQFAECLGACESAPAMLVNETLYKDLTKEKIDRFVASLSPGPRRLAPGP
jgi:NADH-quinone oxidoreductase subunit E